MKELHISSKKREEMIDITREIQNAINQEKMMDGYLIIYVPHTTAGITINEGADPSVQQDIIKTLQQLIPEKNNYEHEEGNSDAHIKASLLGSSVTLLVDKGKLVLGTWQHIFFYEGDGPRNRIVYIHTNKNR
ncbi:MAG: YjbQ family protein [Thermoplasmata archaeon]|nr:YjbQ family protein [Thermoplasmata archaeon]MBE3136716.1 YjbQ family protein [Thermoplasmata archaeon]MBE3140481.1 YjbQ family protein [Thermoplasmata archaeon]